MIGAHLPSEPGGNLDVPFYFFLGREREEKSVIMIYIYLCCW
jgi:hypothetical protein